MSVQNCLHILPVLEGEVRYEFKYEKLDFDLLPSHDIRTGTSHKHMPKIYKEQTRRNDRVGHPIIRIIYNFLVVILL